MKKQTILNKITPEVRKHIAQLTMDLPQIPFFIVGKNGMIPQRMKIGKRISEEEYVASGDKVDESKKPIKDGEYMVFKQTGSTTRMMNHKVTLTEQYQKIGHKGINDYVAYVRQMAIMLEQLKNKPKGAKPAGTSATDGEESGTFPQTKSIPIPEEFGYKEVDAEENGVAGMKGIWTVEGGEAAYNSALAEYNEQPMPEVEK